jgi:hypothetical protein
MTIAVVIAVLLAFGHCAETAIKSENNMKEPTIHHKEICAIGAE